MNEAAPLLNEVNADNTPLPRFRTPRTRCLCPGFMCEMWSFITASLLVFVVAVPTVFFFSWIFILEPEIFILDRNGFDHNESNTSAAYSNTSATKIDLSVTARWSIALSIFLHVVSLVTNLLAHDAATNNSLVVHYVLLAIMGNLAQGVVSIVFFVYAMIAEPIAHFVQHLSLDFLISATTFNAVLLPLPIGLLLCEMRWELSVDRRIAWGIILAQTLPALFFDTIVPATIYWFETSSTTPMPNISNSSEYPQWDLEDEWVGVASNHSGNSTTSQSSEETLVSLCYLIACAAFCALFSIAAAAIALLSKNTPASTGQRQLCVCVLVPFAVFAGMFYMLWFDVLYAVVRSHEWQIAFWLLPAFPVSAIVTVVFAAVPTATVCCNLAALAKKRCDKMRANPHPGRPPTIRTEQPLRSFEDASGLNGLVVAPPSRNYDFTLVWKTTDYTDDIASICSKNSPNTAFGFYRPVPPCKDWVSLGDMCLVGEEMQSIGGEHMHADAFNCDHFGTGGAMALAFGKLVVPAETYSLVWKNRPLDVFREDDDSALFSIWKPDAVTIDSRRYIAMGFVAALGDDQPPPGACHVVLDSALETARSEGRCETLATLVDESSLGSMLFGKQNPLDGYALQRSLPALSERWDAVCSRIRNASSLQVVAGEVKRVCEGDEKFPDYFPELEDHEDAFLDNHERRQLRVKLVQAVQVARRRLQEENWGANQQASLRRALGRLRVPHTDQHQEGARMTIYVHDTAWADSEAVPVQVAPNWDMERLHSEVVLCVNINRKQQQQKRQLGMHDESLTGVPSNLVSVESTMMLHAGRQLGEEDSPRTCRPLAGSFVQCITMGDDDWAQLEDERNARADAKSETRTCPAGHSLEPMPTSSDSYGCNKCSQLCSGAVFGCVVCNYHVCSSCYQGMGLSILCYRHRYSAHGRLKLLLVGDDSVPVYAPKAIFSHAAARRRLNQQSIQGLKTAYRVRLRAWNAAQILFPPSLPRLAQLRSYLRHCTACIFFFFVVSMLLMIPIQVYLSSRHLSIFDVYEKAGLL